MFRTEINIPPSDYKIKLGDPIISIGSCFAQIIGGRLKSHKFKALANPFGVIYNPLSVFELISMGIRNEMPPENSYLENQSVHYNYYFHSDISALSREELRLKTAAAIREMNNYLKNARWALITLGTAYVYKRIDNRQIVANCHKMPGTSFDREMLEPGTIMQSFENLMNELTAFNPNLRVVLTVSPVRYLRDTLPRNSVSKAILRFVCEKLTQKFDNVDYFPSFELMIDDLRDYRFYAPDMAHPNELSENYVWGKFTSTYLDDKALGFLATWEKIAKALTHKPFYPELPAHQAFLKKTMDRLMELSDIVDVSEEILFIKKQLK